MSSILDDVKLELNIEPDDPSFDTEIKAHLNSAFTILHQLGMPMDFRVDNRSTSWEEYLPDNVDAVKDYIYLYIKRMFDPAPTSFANTTHKEILDELAWRIIVQIEDTIPESAHG